MNMTNVTVTLLSDLYEDISRLTLESDPDAAVFGLLSLFIYCLASLLLTLYRRDS